jgi:hypothetical protein
MPRVDLTLETSIERSSRVKQLEGMFDVPENRLAKAEFHFDVPIDDRPWQIGLIVGPSGAGKSRVAKALFGDALKETYDWDADKAVVDGFGDLPVKEVVGALSSVGFASPSGWLKPYRVLSNGEKFRCNLARAIVDPAPLVAVDEFSSVVDRQVARIGAHASAKAVRAQPGKRFVAVTCHEDVLEWLQPDWVLEPHVGTFSWREHHLPNVVGAIIRSLGGVCIVQTSHPGLIVAWAKSRSWRMTAKPAIPSRTKGMRSLQANSANSQGRRIASFRYVGPAHADIEEARRLWS